MTSWHQVLEVTGQFLEVSDSQTFTNASTESGRSFQSLMVWGKKLHLYASKLAVGI